MRIRSIKPEFWRSLDIAALSIEDRLLFIGLWSYVDDNGVGVDRVPIIAAELFADDLSRDPRETLGRVSDGIGRLSECGLVQRYSDGSRDYLAVTNWERHQRIDKPNKPRYPLPTSENVTIRETLATPSRNTRETPAPGTGEQRNRGTESSPDGERVQTRPNPSNEPSSSYPAAFEHWWAAYPRKQGKRKALAEWRRATKRIDRDELITKTTRFADFHAREGTDKQFIPLPTTWLNRDGWDDELISRNTQNSWSNVANLLDRKREGDIIDGEVVQRKELPF
nr:MAG TPA: replisome organizer [Caudoviricetes sp.]